MPPASRRRSTTCAEPGCPTIVTTGPRCPAHTTRRDNRSSPATYGYDNRWRKASRAYLLAHPTCAACPKPSEITDHIDGQGPLGPRGYDPTNWQPLCWSCHSRKTATHDRGFGNKPKPPAGRGGTTTRPI